MNWEHRDLPDILTRFRQLDHSDSTLLLYKKAQYIFIYFNYTVLYLQKVSFIHQYHSIYCIQFTQF